MLDTFALIGLCPAKEILLIPTLIFGSYFVDRKIFRQAGVLLFATMMISPALKKIATFFGVGYDFPSGHMFLATTFWGFLFYNIRMMWLMIFVPVVLFMQAWALIYFNYHSFFDVMGGFIFSVSMIFCYILVNGKKDGARNFNNFIFLLSTISFFYFYTNKHYLLLPYICLISLLLSNFVTSLIGSEVERTKGFYIISFAVVLILVSSYIIFPNLNFLFASLLCLWSLGGIDSILINHAKLFPSRSRLRL